MNDTLADLQEHFSSVVDRSVTKFDAETDVENQCFEFFKEGRTSDISWLLGVAVLLAFIVAIVHHVVTKGESGEAFKTFLRTQLKAGLQAAIAVKTLMHDILKASADVTMVAVSPAVALVVFVVKGIAIVWRLFPTWERIQAVAGRALRLLLVPVHAIADHVQRSVVETFGTYREALTDMEEASNSIVRSGQSIVHALKDHGGEVLTQGLNLAGGMLKVARVPTKFFDLLLGNTIFSMIFTSLVSMLVIYFDGGKPSQLKHFLAQVTSSLVLYPDHRMITMMSNMLSTAYGFYTFLSETMSGVPHSDVTVRIPDLRGVIPEDNPNPILIIVVWIVLLMVVIAGHLNQFTQTTSS